MQHRNLPFICNCDREFGRNVSFKLWMNLRLQAQGYRIVIRHLCRERVTVKYLKLFWIHKVRFGKRTVDCKQRHSPEGPNLALRQTPDRSDTQKQIWERQHFSVLPPRSQFCRRRQTCWWPWYRHRPGCAIQTLVGTSIWYLPSPWP